VKRNEKNGGAVGPSEAEGRVEGGREAVFKAGKRERSRWDLHEKLVEVVDGGAKSA